MGMWFAMALSALCSPAADARRLEAASVGVVAAFQEQEDGDLPQLLRQLEDSDPARRAAAFRQLADRGASAVISALTPPLPSAVNARCLRVALFLRSPDPTAWPALGPWRKDDSAAVRRVVAEALGARTLFSVGEEREAWLRDLGEDPDVGVRTAARKALVAIDREASARALIALAERSFGTERVEFLRYLTQLRSARPFLLDLRTRYARRDLAAHLEIAYALGGASLYAEAAERLDELVDRLAEDLNAADPAFRDAGAFALRTLDAELRAALAWPTLERQLERLALVSLGHPLPLQRLAVLRAFELGTGSPESALPGGVDGVLDVWARRCPDVRLAAGRDLGVQRGIIKGIHELLAGNHAAAVSALQSTSSAVDVALRRWPSDRWGGWPQDAVRLPSSEAEQEEQPFFDFELWDEEIAKRGLERRRPIFHFDLVQRDLLREDARARLIAVFVACLDPSVTVDPEEEARVAMERLLEAYALSVAIEGNSFREQERLPNFGENIDLVLDGETGLYELWYALARRGRFAELPAALSRFAAAIEAQGPWAAREIASPRGYETEPEVLDIDSFVRYRRRNPSRFRIVWGQLLNDTCGEPEAAMRVYREAMEGYAAATRDWTWAARLQAQAVLGLANCHMAQRDADAVSAALEHGLTQLEALRAALERSGGPHAGDWLHADMASLYVSLAVNENVLRKRPERGMAHMRRALELDASDFNWVLSACYLARVGEHEEARAVLARIPPQPAMAYNRGCTLALLGDRDAALHWLAIDLQENHLSAASKAQQSRWAWDDPDLEALRGDPGFQELYGPKPD